MKNILIFAAVAGIASAIALYLVASQDAIFLEDVTDLEY